MDFNLTYTELKQMARTGMEHDFLPGKSLWSEPDKFTTPAVACRSQLLGAEKPTAACKAFLDSNEKAAAQWEQERRYRAFEAKW